MYRLGAVVSGGGTNLQAVLDAVEDGRISNGRMELVISTNSHAYALERARAHKVETLVLSKTMYRDNSDRERDLLDALKTREIDLLVLCGSFMVFSADFIESFGKPIINIHPSLLPDFGGKGFYGLAVHEAVLEAGREVTGATVHYVDGGIDTGEIILQKEIAVHKDDTPETLQTRVMEEGEWKILPEAIAILLKDFERFGR
ncbi:MAG: phosphoribosylglycinamide formyltransferase [Defluviitaleaceae bacterium]|nr:phosphoribosylglycinamide formyltransferase [Defluviitaleaceae bacterium]